MLITCSETQKEIYCRLGKRRKNEAVKLRVQGKSWQVITGFVKTDVCQFHFRRNIKRRIATIYLNSSRLCCFCDISSRQSDIYFKKKRQEIIMWLVIFMAVCTIPLVVLGCVCLWQEKQWEKHNEPKVA